MRSFRSTRVLRLSLLVLVALLSLSAITLILIQSPTLADAAHGRAMPLLATGANDAEVGAAGLPTGTISGTIKLQNGGVPAFARANVCLATDPPSCLAAFTTNPYEAYIDGDGKYAIAVPPGVYKVSFEGDVHKHRVYLNYFDDVLTYAEATTVNVVAGQVTPNINGTLVGFSRITGTVTALNGEPIEGAGVLLCPVATSTHCAGVPYDPGQNDSDADGKYDLNTMDAGTYRILFSHPDYLAEYYNNTYVFTQAQTITVGIEATVAGVNAQLVQAGSISGTITSEAGGPVEDARIQFTAMDGTEEPLRYFIRTDASGDFAIPSMPAGAYTVLIDGGLGDDTYFADEITVTVAAGANPPLNRTLKVARVVEGRVTAAGSGAPISGIRVAACLAISNGCTTFSDFDDHFTDTDANGDYRIGGMSPGAYYLAFATSSNTWLAELYDDVTGFQSGATYYLDGATTIDLTSAFSATIDADLAEPASISGKVTSQLTGGAIAGIVIAVCRVTLTGCIQIPPVATNGTGDYAYTHLAPGSYRLRFEDRGAEQIYLPSDIATLTIASGQAATLNGALRREASLNGKVYDDEGTPLDGVTVRACLINQNDPCENISTATTSANGSYTLRGLNPVNGANVFTIFFDDTSGVHKSLFFGGKESINLASTISLAAGEARTGLDIKLPLLTGGTPTSTPLPGTTPTATPTPTRTPTPTPSPTPPPSVIATLVVLPGTAAQTTVDATDGLQTGQSIVIEVPEGAVDEPTVLSVGLLTSPPVDVDGLGGLVFTISATQGGSPASGLQFNVPVTLTITYRDADVAGLDEAELTLRFYDDATGTWSSGGIVVISRDLAANRIVVTVAHLTTFALFQTDERVLLPIVGK